MRIFTITLNPAFDIHCNVEGFSLYRESIAEIISREAGGKGVNISRALASVGRDNTAIVASGSENGDEFSKMLRKDLCSVELISLDGRIRENITLHEENKPETRISFGGFSADRGLLRAVRDKIGEVDSDTVVTFTGSIPRGIEPADAVTTLRDLKNAGAKVVVDSRSLSLAELLEIKPWLIKPNKDEIEGYIGRKITDVKDAADVALDLFSAGIENVMISLGGDGAVLSNDGGTFYAKPPSVCAVSTVGAGDSTVAGFIHGFCEGYSPRRILAIAVAFGTSACMQCGTKPPKKEDILRIESEVEISE